MTRPMTSRIVVTAVDKPLSTTEVDGVVLPTGRMLHPLWTSGESDARYPGPGAMRFMRLTISPGEAVASGDDGMHATATVDMGVVLAGTVVLEVDGDEPVTLAAGDSFVQQGTRHRWQNAGAEPAVLSVAVIGVAPE
jgi:mannose-6-phosphate isomerase-like protein (cupin superfamily)